MLGHLELHSANRGHPTPQQRCANAAKGVVGDRQRTQTGVEQDKPEMPALALKILAQERGVCAVGSAIGVLEDQDPLAVTLIQIAMTQNMNNMNWATQLRA